MTTSATQSNKTKDDSKKNNRKKDEDSASEYETVTDDSSFDDDDDDDDDDDEDYEEEEEDDDDDDETDDASEDCATSSSSRPRKKRKVIVDSDDDNYKAMEKTLFKMLKRKAQNILEENATERSKKQKTKHKHYKKQNKHSSSEDDDDDDDEDEDDDEDYVDDVVPKDKINSTGIILAFDGFGAVPNDEKDFKKMNKEDKNEKCNSDDEEIFMKESYQKVSLPDTPVISPVSSAKKQRTKNRKSKKRTSKDNHDNNNNNTQTVDAKYNELVKVRKDLLGQLEKTPHNEILRNAIKECKKSILELIKKERKKNTEEYYNLIHQEPTDKKNTNEMSFFKKKMSHKEQLRVMKDLKEINALTNIDKPYRLALLESDIPPKFKAIALQKLNVLKSMSPSDSEYYKMKNWVDGFMRIPYGINKKLGVNISDGQDQCHAFLKNAKKTLDSCTYGLNDAKLQIMQMIGQWMANPSAMGTAIAIKGPPGTGKTTLVKEGISKILGRDFAFIALGGTSDASFLEGHSYTYEGSTWGKIVSILMESKSMNPVIYFDELDKISDTAKGEEIAGILTHLTDTSQNSLFHDKYFSEVHFDLSRCLFIFSYNDESKINPILKDRMYRIQTKGYAAKEKIIIARKHLLPKICEQVSFREDEVIIPDETLQYIISHPDFCKEELGVRNLKRCLEIIHTKLNLFRLVKPEENLFGEDIQLSVTFPFKVEKTHVDLLIKSDDPTNQSMLSMYI